MGKLGERKPVTGFKSCQICSKSFPYRDSLKVRSTRGIARGGAKFCSRPCSNKGTAIRNRTVPPSAETLKKLRILAIQRFTGRRLSERERRERSERYKGARSHFWKGGVCKPNQLARQDYRYANWRKAVYDRDDYTCQICKKRGGKLNADHIQPWAQFPELRFELSNGRTLCLSCHRKTPTWGRRFDLLRQTIN